MKRTIKKSTKLLLFVLLLCNVKQIKPVFLEAAAISAAGTGVYYLYRWLTMTPEERAAEILIKVKAQVRAKDLAHHLKAKTAETKIAQKTTNRTLYLPTRSCIDALFQAQSVDSQAQPLAQLAALALKLQEQSILEGDGQIGQDIGRALEIEKLEERNQDLSGIQARIVEQRNARRIR